jgi:hypothetical protein
MSDAAINVRILAHWTDDPTESPLTIDASLDVSSKRIAGKWTIFGATCMDTAQSRPFALDNTGVIDFGAYCTTDERIWRTNLRTCEIAVGATFVVTWAGGDQGVYAIDKVARLGSKSG